MLIQYLLLELLIVLPGILKNFINLLYAIEKTSIARNEVTKKQRSIVNHSIILMNTI